MKLNNTHHRVGDERQDIMSWFVEGNASGRDEFIKNAYNSKVNKFWLNKGETREIIFTSDERFGVYEHTIPMNGRFESYTCGGSNCVFCGLQKPRNYQEYCSILDLTPYTSKKDNKEHKYSKRALGVGKEIATLLDSRRKDLGGSLVGKKFKVTRIGDKSKTCGNDWVHVPMEKAVDLSKLPPEAKPYDFKDVLRPLPAEQVQALLNYSGQNSSAGSFNPGASSGVSSRESLLNGTTSGVSGLSDANNFDQETDIPF